MENEKLQKKALSEKELDLVTGGSWADFCQWAKNHFPWLFSDKKDQSSDNKSMIF